MPEALKEEAGSVHCCPSSSYLADMAPGRQHHFRYYYFVLVFYFVLFCETRSCPVAQASLELKILLLQPPECWPYPAELFVCLFVCLLK